MLSVSDLSEESNVKDHQKKRGRGASKAKILVMTSFDERLNKKQELKNLYRYVSILQADKKALRGDNHESIIRGACKGVFARRASDDQ